MKVDAITSVNMKVDAITSVTSGAKFIGVLNIRSISPLIEARDYASLLTNGNTLATKIVNMIGKRNDSTIQVSILCSQQHVSTCHRPFYLVSGYIIAERCETSNEQVVGVSTDRLSYLD
jgi:hypothetical protein